MSKDNKLLIIFSCLILLTLYFAYISNNEITKWLYLILFSFSLTNLLSIYINKPVKNKKITY